MNPVFNPQGSQASQARTAIPISRSPHFSRSTTAWTEEAISRAAGASPTYGNQVRFLKNATENYPAWLSAIESAKERIHFETYYMTDDAVGRQFAEALMAKARQGVQVRLIYDWMGGFTRAPRRFWREMTAAGIEVRCFNPFRVDSPFGWVRRDHRKTVSVDGRIAYVAGLCVGQDWLGHLERGIGPWRDDGIEIAGPALGEIDHAFAETWAVTGPPLAQDEITDGDSIEAAGDVAVRVVANTPNFGGTYRVDQLFAHLAKRSIWIHDAYFIGTAAYVQALQAAAAAGVDVRIIVPGMNDILFLGGLSRAGFRPMLQSGIRVFQWNGPMMHAKSAVVDGRWTRVGSTNLNITGWLGNWELDVLVDDERLAKTMEDTYLEDLEHTAEIVLTRWQKRPRVPHHRRHVRGSATRVAAGVLRIGNTIGASVSNRRELGPAEANVMVVGAALLITISLLAIKWPKVVTIPIIVLGIWVGISLLLRAYRLRVSRK
jgi:cardiolipin synthase A/B